MTKEYQALNLSAYDLDAVYHKEVKPLLDKVAEICEGHDLPFFHFSIIACDEKRGRNGEAMVTAASKSYLSTPERGDELIRLFRHVLRSPFAVLLLRRAAGMVDVLEGNDASAAFLRDVLVAESDGINIIDFLQTMAEKEVNMEH